MCNTCTLCSGRDGVATMQIMEVTALLMIWVYCMYWGIVSDFAWWPYYSRWPLTRWPLIEVPLYLYKPEFTAYHHFATPFSPSFLSYTCIFSCSLQGSALISFRQMDLSPNLPHFQESSWMGLHISREESRDILQGRPDGTFLVRPKPGVGDQIPNNEPLHTHTIDIVWVLMTGGYWISGPLDHWIGGPLDHWIGGSLDQWTIRPLDWWVTRSVDHWIGGPLDHWIGGSLDQWTIRPLDWWVIRSVDH